MNARRSFLPATSLAWRNPGKRRRVDDRVLGLSVIDDEAGDDSEGAADEVRAWRRVGGSTHGQVAAFLAGAAGWGKLAP